MEVLLWCGGEKASLLTRRCESTGGGTRSCDGGENDAGTVERAWFRWCVMAAEAATMVVREEEELAGGSRVCRCSGEDGGGTVAALLQLRGGANGG